MDCFVAVAPRNDYRRYKMQMTDSVGRIGAHRVRAKRGPDGRNPPSSGRRLRIAKPMAVWLRDHRRRNRPWLRCRRPSPLETGLRARRDETTSRANPCTRFTSPCLSRFDRKTWMAGTSPAMTMPSPRLPSRHSSYTIPLPPWRDPYHDNANGELSQIPRRSARSPGAGRRS